MPPIGNQPASGDPAQHPTAASPAVILHISIARVVGAAAPDRYPYPETVPTQTFRYAPALIAVIALTGCSAHAGTATSTIAATSTPSTRAMPTLTPTPTPTAMSTDDAAAVYEAGACAVNLKARDFNNAWQSASGDISALQEAAAAARDASSATATELDQAKWPDELKADIALVRDGYFSQAAVLSQIAASPTWDAAIHNSFPATDAASAASQRLRSRLGLPSDPLAC